MSRAILSNDFDLVTGFESSTFEAPETSREIGASASHNGRCPDSSAKREIEKSVFYYSFDRELITRRRDVRPKNIDR